MSIYSEIGAPNLSEFFARDTYNYYFYLEIFFILVNLKGNRNLQEDTCNTCFVF